MFYVSVVCYSVSMYIFTFYSIHVVKIMSSVWKYYVSVWGGNSSKRDIDRVTSTIRKASTLLETPQESFIDNYEKLSFLRQEKHKKG